MYPQVSPRVSVYTSLIPDLLEYLNRVTLFNTRKESPTRWELEIHTGLFDTTHWCTIPQYGELGRPFIIAPRVVRSPFGYSRR